MDKQIEKKEGVLKPFGAAMYAEKFGEPGKMVFAQKFYKLGQMVIDRALGDISCYKEDHEICQGAHAWMGKAGKTTGSFAYWLHPTPTEDALAVLDDYERRVLSAALDPKFDYKGNCTRERLRWAEVKVLRKLRALN